MPLPAWAAIAGAEDETRMPLEPEKCRLVSEEQVALFNELDLLLGEVQEQLPRVADRGEFRGVPHPETKLPQGIMPDRDRLRENLLRTHYQVGLLGVTGASKSTSLNSLIGQKVLPQGSESMPCTSVIQRIRFVAPESRPSLDLVFMDLSEWGKRRKMMCDRLDLSPYASDDKDDELLDALEQRRQDPTVSKNKAVMLDFFRRFLLGKKHYGKRLAVGHHVGPLELPDLRALAQALESVASHQGASKEVPVGNETLSDCECALLREVFISIPLPSPPQELELVDLPGFLAGSGQDDVITKSYLDRLDGACFLLNSQNLGLSVFDEVREDLVKRFQSLLGRVWLLVTKIDSLGADGLHSAEKSVFHGIDTAVRKWDLEEPEEIYRHLLITSNEIYRLTRGKDESSIRTIIGTKLSYENFDEQSPLPLPVALRDDHQLAGVRRAFEHVLEDGGLSRLRGVVQTELAQSVRKAVAEAARQTLVNLVERTIRVVESCRDRRGLTKDDHDVAIDWSNLFREMERRKNLVDDLASESLARVKRSLLALVDRYCPGGDNLPDMTNLRTRHFNLASSLSEEAQTAWLGEPGATHDRLEGVVGEVIRRLERTIRELASPAQLEGRSKNLEAVLKPLVALQTFSEEIVRRNPKHAEQFAEVACPELFQDSWPTDIHPRTYRQMMIRKIDNLLFEATHRLQNAVRSALAEVQNRLENLGRDDSTSTDPISRETYEQYLEKLHAYRAKLNTSSQPVAAPLAS
jgi:hypothetical protein